MCIRDSTITEENISIDKYNLDGIEVIYKGKIVREFMVAYYFMQTIMKKYNKSDADYKRLCSIPFVFTPIINKFGKEMLINSSAIDQLNIVRNLIDMYNDVNITMSMKDQICYFLGRVGRQKAKNKAGYFLEEQAIELEKKIYFNEECERDEEELQMLLVLYRTISVSLVIMDNIKYIEEYINHLIYDDNLNSINRGFHIEYYSDKEYRLGESPDYFDDTNYHVDNTLSFLINVIKGKLSYDKFTVGCSIYLDIITLFSIYISRISEPDICDKYTEQVKGIADMISKSVKILDPTITNYVLMVQEVINSEKKPYKHFMDEMSRLKSTKRSGWIIRGIQNPESIADHILGTVYLANHFLPDNINEFKEYKGIGDIKKYKNSYDKEKIIKMLLIHDMGEANVGDHIDKSEEISNKENVRFSYYAMLCTLPKIHGMNINKDYWDEFFKQDTINAQIAYDIDKLEALIQAYNYKREGQDIKLDEWIISVRSNMKTSLGDALLQFFVKEIIDK